MRCLTSEQKSIVATCTPPVTSGQKGSVVRVTAAAGTGKTTTLLSLAVFAIRHQQHIRVNYATFTRAAAKDGQTRLRKALQGVTGPGGEIPYIDARTLQSFAFELINQHDKFDGEGNDDVITVATVWTDAQMRKWISRQCVAAIDEFLLPAQRHIQQQGQGGRRNQTASKLQRAREQVEHFIFKSLELFCRSNWTLDHFKKNRQGYGRNYYPAILFHKPKGPGESYGFCPADYDNMDTVAFYSDQAAKLWDMIDTNPAIRSYSIDMKKVQLMNLTLPGTLTLVDESQDMDACQVDWIVQQHARAGHHVYAVGDPAQAIYGFRGAKPKFLLELGCDQCQLLTNSWRFGPEISNLANLVLFAKEKSEQTSFNYDGTPKNWDPYRTQSGDPNKTSLVTRQPILHDWQAGAVTLIGRTNASCLLGLLPLLGFDLGEDEEEDTVRDRVVDEYGTSPIQSASVDEQSGPTPKVHLNGKGESSGAKLWHRTIAQVESAYNLYAFSKAEPDGCAYLDSHHFPDFANTLLSWGQFVEDCEHKELSKYSNVICVIEKLKDQTLKAMDQFRDSVLNKNYSSREADVILTTAHSSKGMEWKRVQLCSDFLDLCIFKPAQQSTAPSREQRPLKKQKTAPNWKFGFKPYGDDVNLLYVALTRAIDVLSLPDCSVTKVAKTFDVAHQWKVMKSQNSALGKQLLSIPGVGVEGRQKVLTEEEALEFYTSLVEPLRREFKLERGKPLETYLFADAVSSGCEEELDEK